MPLLEAEVAEVGGGRLAGPSLDGQGQVIEVVSQGINVGVWDLQWSATASSQQRSVFCHTAILQIHDVKYQGHMSKN